MHFSFIKIRRKQQTGTVLNRQTTMQLMLTHPNTILALLVVSLALLLGCTSATNALPMDSSSRINGQLGHQVGLDTGKRLLLLLHRRQSAVSVSAPTPATAAAKPPAPVDPKPPATTTTTTKLPFAASQPTKAPQVVTTTKAAAKPTTTVLPPPVFNASSPHLPGRPGPPHHPTLLSHTFKTHQSHPCSLYSYPLEVQNSVTLRICHPRSTPFSLQSAPGDADSTFGALKGGDGTKPCRVPGTLGNDPKFSYIYMPQNTTAVDNAYSADRQEDTVCVERTWICHYLPRTVYFSAAIAWDQMPGGFKWVKGQEINVDVVAGGSCDIGRK